MKAFNACCVSNSFSQCSRITLCLSHCFLSEVVKFLLTGQWCIAAKGTTLIRHIQAMWFYVIEFGSLPLLEQQARFWLWMVTVYYRVVLLVIVKLLSEYPLVLGTCWCSFYLFVNLFFSCKILINYWYVHSYWSPTFWCCLKGR